MSILSSLFEKIQKEKAQKQSAKSKLVDFEKMIADEARSQGMMPRNYLVKLCQQSESFANSKLVKVLLGERDVPTQKGRDAKPQVLTKRAMNVVKKGIKQAANKQRRRMDKDAVEEDGKDDFSKSVNPMGQDSKALDKIKKSPGFYDMLVVFFSSAVQDDRDDEEVLPIMSSMFNMNVEEIKAVLRQYGGHTFSGSSPEDKFKANMGATGFLGKGKTRTVNSVYEDAEQDAEYAKMIIQQNPQEYKKFMQTGDLMDAPTIYEKLFAYFSSSDAEDMMPYGTQKARTGDPYVWLVDKLDDLGLTEGNEFAQKVRQLKATGAKKGTKFKTSDGEEHTLEGDLNAWYAEQYAKELAEKDGKVWDRMPYGDKEDYRKIANKKYGVVKSEGIEGLVEKMILMKDQVADAVADRVKDWAKSASVEQINKVLAMIKSPAKLKPEGPTSASMEEDKTDAEIDDFHRELDQLVHKHFGHSSDEKKEKVKEDAITEEEFEKLAEKKDACYHKVKSRYKVWPSAYASGALVQCRKKGAANWGNKSD